MLKRFSKPIITAVCLILSFCLFFNTLYSNGADTAEIGDDTSYNDGDFGLIDPAYNPAYDGKEDLPGDLDENGAVDDDDAVYLLFYTFFPEDYPFTCNADFDGDGEVTDDDAVYLLFYTFFPEDYPLTAEYDILYSKNVNGLTLDQVREMWPSNSERSWILTGKMDNEITRKYMCWSTVHQTEGYENGLPEGVDLSVRIPGLDINVDDYREIRLVIDYFCSALSTSPIKCYSMLVFAYDQNGSRFGPFYIDCAEPKGYCVRKQTTDKCDKEYEIVIENISAPPGTVLKELEIIPYGNMPICADENCRPNNYHVSNGALFNVSEFKVLGCKNGGYKRPYYIEITDLDETKARTGSVQRAYDLATVKWTPAADFHEAFWDYDSNTESFRINYKVGEYYYGTPYTGKNTVTVERFASVLDEQKTLPIPENWMQFCGADCASTVSYSISKYVQAYFQAGCPEYIWNKNIATVLGGMEVDPKSTTSITFKDDYSEQHIFEAYAGLLPGDIVSCFDKYNGHVRIISGNTHVEYRTDGTIDPDKSYVFRTDIASYLQNTTANNGNEIGGNVGPGDYVVPFVPNPKYTDLKTLADLSGKNINFHINNKTTFRRLYNDNYLPIRLNAYITGKVERPYARIENPNTAADIAKGIKGTVCSNYTLIDIKFEIRDLGAQTYKTYTVYPNQATNNIFEQKFSSTYSLCHSTPQYIKDEIAAVTKTGNYEISVYVTAGESENMRVLTLHS